MKRKLDYKVLQDALYNLIELDGVKPSEITNSSGVHNIQETAEGSNRPYKSTWLKLHKAYPNDIPPPTYINDGREYNGVTSIKGNSNTSLNNSTYNVANQLSVEEQVFINRLRKVDKDGAYLRKITIEVMQMIE